MVKLIIFFRMPADVDAFEEYFANTHVPLINAMPNMRRAAVTRALGAPRGEPPFYLIHEVYFEDLPMLTYALNSPEGRAAGADLMGFAREIVSLMFAEVWGEDPFELGLIGHEPAPAEEAAPQSTEPAADKSSLVPIDTSFLEKPAKPMTVEEAILGPDYKQAMTAETPAEVVAEAPAIEAVAAVDAVAAPAEEAAPAAPITESTVAESAQAEAPATEVTPAQTTLTESAVVEEQAEAVTPSDTPAPEHPRPQ
jgi:uncharacterized protein (TIGR02118 family)